MVTDPNDNHSALQLPGYAEHTTLDNGKDGVHCTVCGNEAPDLASLTHDCIYANDLIADGGTSQAALIQCTRSKRDNPAPARDLYDKSDYFNDMKPWAKARPGPWFILSAKHGLVEPDDWLAPYNAYGLSEEQAREIAVELWKRGFDTIHVTAGREYTKHLVPALEERGIDVVNHFAGEKIGDRQSLLQQATRELVNYSL